MHVIDVTDQSSGTWKKPNSRSVLKFCSVVDVTETGWQLVSSVCFNSSQWSCHVFSFRCCFIIRWTPFHIETCNLQTCSYIRLSIVTNIHLFSFKTNGTNSASKWMKQDYSVLPRTNYTRIKLESIQYARESIDLIQVRHCTRLHTRTSNRCLWEANAVCELHGL